MRHIYFIIIAAFFVSCGIVHAAPGLSRKRHSHESESPTMSPKEKRPRLNSKTRKAVREICDKLEDLEFPVTADDESVIEALVMDYRGLGYRTRSVVVDHVFNDMLDAFAGLKDEADESEYEDSEGEESEYGILFIYVISFLMYVIF